MQIKPSLFTENDLIHYADSYGNKKYNRYTSCFDKTTGEFIDHHGHFERIIVNNIVEYLEDNTRCDSICKEVTLEDFIPEEKITDVDTSMEIKNFIHELYYNSMIVNINYHRIDEQKFLFINIIPSDPQAIKMSIDMTISWYKDRGHTEVLHFNGKPATRKEFVICMSLVQFAIPELDMFSY